MAPGKSGGEVVLLLRRGQYPLLVEGETCCRADAISAAAGVAFDSRCCCWKGLRERCCPLDVRVLLLL